jgi:hypothetical protein
MASSINASTSAGVVTTADTSGVLNIQTAGTTAISIDASQAVSFTNAPTVTGGIANGVAYLNGSKVLTTGSALQFDVNNTFSISQANNASCAVFTNSNASLSGFGNSGLLIQFAQNTTNNSYSPLSVYNSGAAAYKFRMADSGAIATAGSISLGTVTPATSGIGVQFPATQSASSNANTLDDYEEGTFTPTVTATSGSNGGGTFTGSYIKIGRFVYVTLGAVSVSKGTLSGTINVGGLPFEVNAINATATCRWELGSGGVPAVGTTIMCPQSSGSTTLEIQQFSNSGYLGLIAAGNLGATFSFYNITYSYITLN